MGGVRHSLCSGKAGRIGLLPEVEPVHNFAACIIAASRRGGTRLFDGIRSVGASRERQECVWGGGGTSARRRTGAVSIHGSTKTKVKQSRQSWPRRTTRLSPGGGRRVGGEGGEI